MDSAAFCCCGPDCDCDACQCECLAIVIAPRAAAREALIAIAAPLAVTAWFAIASIASKTTVSVRLAIAQPENALATLKSL